MTQLLILSSKRIVENDVVRTAVGCGLCEITGMQLQSNGATSAEQRKILLDRAVMVTCKEDMARRVGQGVSTKKRTRKPKRV